MSELNDFLKKRLRVDDVRSMADDDSPPWWQEGITVEVDESTYYDYLDLLPPRYMSGSLFAFGEGSGNFALFWMQDKKYFVHQLSLDDTETFCRLTRVVIHQ